MNQKFIINEGRLKTGVVDQHYQLATNHSTTRGGGWWYMDVENHKIWLYGRSIRFGRVSRELLQQVLASGMHDYPNFSWYFSRADKLEKALKDGVLISF